MLVMMSSLQFCPVKDHKLAFVLVRISSKVTMPQVRTLSVVPTMPVQHDFRVQSVIDRPECNC